MLAYQMEDRGGKMYKKDCLHREEAERIRGRASLHERITERTRKLRSLDSPVLPVGLIKFLGAKFVLDSGFGNLALIKYSTSGADAFRGNTRTHPEHDG